MEHLEVLEYSWIFISFPDYRIVFRNNCALVKRYALVCTFRHTPTCFGCLFFSLKHFGHLSQSCIKTRRTVFIYLYFQTFWPKWLNFFQSFQKGFGLWPKKRTWAVAADGIYCFQLSTLIATVIWNYQLLALHNHW